MPYSLLEENIPPSPYKGERGGGPGLLNVMKDSTKKTIKRIFEIIITILTALITTLSTHAAVC